MLNDYINPGKPTFHTRTALQFLRDTVHDVLSESLHSLCNVVLNDPNFAEAPGSTEHHHNYPKGLVQHVAEVMNNVIELTGGIPSEELVTAVIWHDYMKTRDYSLDHEGNIIKQEYRKRINHLPGSFAEFYHTAKTMDFSQEFIDEVSHLLLSHHGRKEWGSPVEPRTADAFILHTADMMSASGIIL